MVRDTHAPCCRSQICPLKGRWSRGDHCQVKMKHFHYCPKCHQSPPCERSECQLIGANSLTGNNFSHHETCSACEVMALAEASRANPFAEASSAAWFATYNSVFPWPRRG